MGAIFVSVRKSKGNKNMKEKEIIETIKNKIEEFQDSEVYVEFENAIQYQTTIKNCKIIVSDQKLILSDEEKKDLIIELYYISELEVYESTIKMIMENDLTITITC